MNRESRFFRMDTKALTREHPEKAALVNFRFYVGLSVENRLFQLNFRVGRIFSIDDSSFITMWPGKNGRAF